MHERPAHAWTLEELARTARLSRTAFAENFKRVVGETPIAYLTRWRMTLATHKPSEKGPNVGCSGAPYRLRVPKRLLCCFQKVLRHICKEVCGCETVHFITQVRRTLFFTRWPALPQITSVLFWTFGVVPPISLRRRWRVIGGFRSAALRSGRPTMIMVVFKPGD